MNGSKDLLDATLSLSKVFSESVQAEQTKVYEAAVKAGLDSAASASSIEDAIKSLSSAAGAIGGAVLCSEMPAMVGVCAAAGSWVGEKVGEIVVKIPDVISAKGDQSKAGVDVFKHPYYCLNVSFARDKRKKILSYLSQSGDDPEVIARIKELADRVAPEFYSEQGGVLDKADASIPKGFSLYQNNKDNGPIYEKAKKAFGVGYTSLMCSGPYLTAPNIFKKETDPPDFTPSWGKNSYCYMYSWRSPANYKPSDVRNAIVSGMVDPFLKEGMPVAWIKDQINSSPIAQAESYEKTWQDTFPKAVELMVPQIDKWVESRIKWILEESAIKRNARATVAIKKIGESLRAIHPKWSEADVQKAQEAIQRSIASGDTKKTQMLVSEYSFSGSIPIGIVIPGMAGKNVEGSDGHADSSSHKEEGGTSSDKKEEPKKKTPILMIGIAALIAAYAATR